MTIARASTAALPRAIGPQGTACAGAGDVVEVSTEASATDAALRFLGRFELLPLCWIAVVATAEPASISAVATAGSILNSPKLTPGPARGIGREEM